MKWFLSVFIMLYPFVLYGISDPNLDALPDNGVRELASATQAYQEYTFKSVEYTMNVSTPGFIRRSVTSIRTYDEDFKKPEVSIYNSRKWIDNPPVYVDNPLYFALNSNSRGFFMLQLPHGLIGYTRDGRFRLNHENRLVNLTNGFPVIGVDGDIFIDGMHDITASRSGAIYQNGTLKGKLKIAVFHLNDLRKLKSINGVVFYLTQDADIRHDENLYAVLQRYVLESNAFKSHDSKFIKNYYKSAVLGTDLLIKASQHVIRDALAP